MPDQTSAEIEAQIKELEAQAEKLREAEASEKFSQMHPEELLTAALREIADKLGNHSRLERLVSELEKRSAPKE